MNISLDILLNESIKNVFYYHEYDGFHRFDHIDEIQEIPFLGLLIETANSKFITIIEYDCSQGADLGGISVFQSESPFNPGDQLNHINEHQWARYSGRKIISSKVLEIIYAYDDGRAIVVPSGLQLIFDNREVLYVMNIYIESYNEEKKEYTFINGQHLVLFYTEDAFRKYGFSDLRRFNIISYP